MISALIGLGGACSFLPPARAQEAEFDPGALDLFFQLGLPDTRGAKWVKAHAYYDPTIKIAGSELSGNAWLVGERPDGTVELITGFARREVCRRAKNDEEGVPRRFAKRGNSGESDLPSMVIEPADLKKDIQVLKKALGRTPEESEMSLSIPGMVGSDDYNFRQLPPDYRQSTKAGSLLLFLGQVKRNGHDAEAKELSRLLMARIPLPNVALDAAVSVIGDARLEALNRAWVAKGDRAEYVAGLESLAGELTRGWGNRDVVLYLARRVRDAKAAPESNSPDAEAAAKLLMALRQKDEMSLPVAKNWLVPGSSTTQGDVPDLEDFDEPVEAGTASVPPKESVDSPVNAFFQQRRKAAMALARLANDTRFLRLLNDGFFQTGSFSFDSDQNTPARRYGRLSRPLELGELAWKLLSPLLPESERTLIENGDRSAGTLAWLKRVEKLSDEELAWELMRNADGAADDEFLNGLSYLVENGGEESVKRLREVFLDPAIWDDDVDSALPFLESYIKRMKDDPAPFMEQVKAVVASLFKAQIDELESGGNSASEDVKKSYAVRHATELKKLDRILKPSQLSELLTELEGMSEEAAELGIQEIRLAAKNMPLHEARTQILQAAAQISKPASRQGLLRLLNTPVFLYRTRRGGEEPEKDLDDATRTAILKLLDDDAEVAGLGLRPASTDQTIASLTATNLAWPRLPEGEHEKWTAISEQAPQVYQRAIVEWARAFAQRKEVPPRPDGSRVSAARIGQLMGELGTFDGPKLLEQFRALPADEQLALMDHLAKAPEWPPAFRSAQLCVVSISGEGADKLDTQTWKGRLLDEAFINEVTAAFNKSAFAQPVMLRVISTGALSGLSVEVTNKEVREVQSVDPERLQGFKIPGLEKRPVPAALAFRMLQLGANRNPRNMAMYWYPLWKDEGIANQWREENVKQTGDVSPTDLSKQRMPIDPRYFQKTWKSIVEAKALGTPFVLIWNAIPVKSAEAAESSER